MVATTTPPRLAGVASSAPDRAQPEKGGVRVRPATGRARRRGHRQCRHRWPGGAHVPRQRGPTPHGSGRGGRRHLRGSPALWAADPARTCQGYPGRSPEPGHAVVALGVAVDVVSARSLRFHPGAVVLLGAFVAAVLLRAFPPLFDTATRLSGAARNALARTEKAVVEDASGEPGPVPVLSAREIVSFLADTELFRKVDRRALRKLAEATATRPVGKGQTIFAQGDHGDQMFVLINGAVRLVMRSATGEAVELARLWAPAAFGEVALTDPGDRTATAEAVERSVLLVIDRIDLLELLRSDSDAMEAMLQSQGAMIRHADQLAADVVFLKPQSRVARALLDLAESDTGEGRRPRTLRITRADLASKVGAPQSQVTRILRRFQRLGYIRMVDWTIELLDPAELRRRAGR